MIHAHPLKAGGSAKSAKKNLHFTSATFILRSATSLREAKAHPR